jgi:hypothetical protein
VVAIVAAVALVLVILIVAIAALASGGDDSASSTTTTTEAATTTEEGGSTTTAGGSTTTTTTGSTTTAGSDDYPAAFRQDFLDGCNPSGGNEDYCTCFLEELEATYTLAEVSELDFESLGSDPNAWPPELRDIAVGCI